MERVTQEYQAYQRHGSASAGGGGRESPSHRIAEDRTIVPRVIQKAYWEAPAAVVCALCAALVRACHVPGQVLPLEARPARATFPHCAEVPAGQILQQGRSGPSAQGADDATIH